MSERRDDYHDYEAIQEPPKCRDCGRKMKQDEYGVWDCPVCDLLEEATDESGRDVVSKV